MTGAIYARYSEGSRQTEQSIEGQVADCRAYAAAHGIDVIEIYADRHVSGTSTAGRDEFQRMMHDADKHRFDAVITWKIDRFGRSREDIAVNKIRLRKAGVQLHYAKEAVPEGPEGILLESLLEGLAEYYSVDLRQKVSRGIRECAKKGQLTGMLPVGYQRGPDKRVEIDPEKAEAVREVFRQYLAGASYAQLKETLAKRGITSRRGGLPADSVVGRILRNEHYLGRYEVQGVEVLVDPIIDQATFDAVAAKIKGRHVAGRSTVDYLLSCKCHCELCGSLLRGSYGTGKSGAKHYYYRCSGKGCGLKPIRKADLEALVLRHTIEDVLTDNVIEKLTAKIMEIQEAEHAADPADALRKELTAAKRRQRNLIEAIENGAGASLVERLNAVEEVIAELTVEIERAQLQRPIVPEPIVRGWLESFRGGDVTDPTFQKRLVQTFVADVIVGPEQVTIAYNTTEKEPGRSVRLGSDAWTYRTISRTPEVIGGLIVVSFPRRQ